MKKKSEVEVCPNCKARVVPADYSVKNGTRTRQISHFCGYSGLPTLISKKKLKRIQEFNDMDRANSR